MNVNTQFSGMYRITGKNKFKITLAGTKIVLKEPFKVVAYDGKDMVLLTRKDAMAFLKSEYQLQTPDEMEHYSVKDWVNPKNFSTIKQFISDVKSHMNIKGKADIQLLEKKVVSYFKQLEQSGKDAYGNKIKTISS